MMLSCSDILHKTYYTLHITQDSDKTELENGVNALEEWTQEWFLKLNASKCMAGP